MSGFVRVAELQVLSCVELIDESFLLVARCSNYGITYRRSIEAQRLVLRTDTPWLACATHQNIWRNVMGMTHYMELLAVNQPWNLIIFMGIPIVLAETLAITELYILFTRNFDGIVQKINRFSGIVVGVYFVFIIIYIVKQAIIPITLAGEWRTIIDVIAVFTYVIGGLPLVWIALQEFGIVDKNRDREGKLKVHATCIAIFLIFGHIAMIFGMLDPAVLGHDGMMEMNHG